MTMMNEKALAAYDRATDEAWSRSVIVAAQAAYHNTISHSGYTTDEERSAARSGIRDVMVRLGLYDRFVAETENAE